MTSGAKMSKPYIKLDETWIDKVPNCPNCGGELGINHGWPTCACMNGKKRFNTALRNEILIRANCKPKEIENMFTNFIYYTLEGRPVLIDSYDKDWNQYTWRRLPREHAFDMMKVKQDKGVRINILEIEGEVDAWALLGYRLKTTEAGGIVDIRQQCFRKKLITNLPFVYIIDESEYNRSDVYDNKPYIFAHDNTMWNVKAILELRRQRPGILPSPIMSERIGRLLKRIQGRKCHTIDIGGWNTDKQVEVIDYLIDHPEASIREMSKALGMSQRIISKALDVLGIICF
jgi:DNA-binding transcriptional ArsR family regulator